MACLPNAFSWSSFSSAKVGGLAVRSLNNDAGILGAFRIVPGLVIISGDETLS